MSTTSNDVTVIFLTVNRVPEKWAAYHQEKLLEAIGDSPLITVSRKLMNLPGINLIQEEEISASNVYRQMLRAAKVATTPYIAIAEDDSLYPRKHFTDFRPQLDEFGYNMCRWSIFTWGVPTYYYTGRMSNLTLLAPTELTVTALEERFAKYPDGTPPHKTGELGKNRYEKPLGLQLNKSVQFYTIIPIVNFNHIYAMDPLEISRRKAMSALRVFDIPHWGRADDLVANFQ